MNEKNLEGILGKYEAKFKLPIKTDNRENYRKFVKWAIENHPEYDRPKILSAENNGYCELLTNMLALYSYLRKDREVATNFNEQLTLLDSKDKLKYIKQKGNDSNSWDDLTLYRLNVSFNRLIKEGITKKSYCQTITEIMQYEEIIEIWGKLTYNDIKSGKRRNNVMPKKSEAKIYDFYGGSSARKIGPKSGT